MRGSSSDYAISSGSAANNPDSSLIDLGAPSLRQKSNQQYWTRVSVIEAFDPLIGEDERDDLMEDLPDNQGAA